MKRKILYLMLLGAIALTGCRGAQTGNTEVTETESQSLTTEPESESEETKPQVTEIKGYGKTFIPSNITDIKDAPNAELFYEDEKYEYYFYEERSSSTIIYYEDGYSETVKEAFTAGRADIYDLGKNYISCFVKEKNFTDEKSPELINIVYTFSGYTTPATDTFYQSGKYRYYYSSGYSTDIFAYYSDGTRENIIPALEAGRITIEDMKKYGLGGIQQLNIANVVDLTENADIQCVQEKEYLYENESYKYYFDCVKSMYIELHYKNGEVETLREALDAGIITDRDISWIKRNQPYGMKIENVPAPLKEIDRSNYNKLPKALDVKEVQNPELLYEDEKYQYYLEFAGSSNISVYYENDTKDKLNVAVEAGKVDVYDLGKVGVGCFVCEKNTVADAQPKLFYIVDSKVNQYVTNGAVYEDDTYEYRIIDRNLNYIYAYYTDGTRQPIAEALKAGRITIADLDANGIEYTKVAK